MKKLFCLLGIFIITGTTFGQIQVDTLVKNGPLNRQINLVFLSDGYQASELTDFIQDTNNILDQVFSISPFREYKSYFNVFAIKVPSNQSGASHPQTSADLDCDPVPQGVVDNYFGSTFDYANIHRLLVPVKNVGSVLANYLPQYDQAFMVVNSDYYGGSGGTFATSSVNTSGTEISIHEIGHSFALLADEYWAGSGYAAEKANMTQQSTTTNVKWKKWVGTNEVGVFPHAENPTWFRPHQNCKMRFLGTPFCPVCTEAFTERIHTLVTPLITFEPQHQSLELETSALAFSLHLLKPEPNTLKIIWKNNGKIIGENTESISIPPSGFTNPKHIIKAEIIDTTSLVRNDLHKTSHVYTVEWTVSTDLVTGIEVTGSTERYKVASYPNPFHENFVVTMELSTRAPVRIQLKDSTGRILKKLLDEVEEPGHHSFSLSAADMGIKKSGLYILHVSIDGSELTQKIVKH